MLQGPSLLGYRWSGVFDFDVGVFFVNDFAVGIGIGIGTTPPLSVIQLRHGLGATFLGNVLLRDV